MNNIENQNELDLFYKKYSKDFADLAIYYRLKAENFDILTLKEKIFTLACLLKKEKRFNFAGFLFDKLFTTLLSMEALTNKIDCLIALKKFEDALHFNHLGFELFLEMEENSNTENIEKMLSYQKAIILFSSLRFTETCMLCESNIIKSRQKTFFSLLCASLIMQEKFDAAERLLERSRSLPYVFLSEIANYLLSINQTSAFMKFLSSLHSTKICCTHQYLAEKLEELYNDSKDKRHFENLLKREVSFFNIEKKETTIFTATLSSQNGGVHYGL